MQDILSFIDANGIGVAAVLTGAYALAIAVARLTPTKRDDKLVARIGAPVTLVAEWLRRRKAAAPTDKEATP